MPINTESTDVNVINFKTKNKKKMYMYLDVIPFVVCMILLPQRGFISWEKT